MQIEGVFSGDELDDYPVCLNTYGQMGLKYAKNLDENVHLNLKEIPVFESILDVYIKESGAVFKNHKILDICLSLFYLPYFEELYSNIMQYGNQFSKRGKKYLIQNMLNYLADDMQYEIIVKRDMIDHNVREYYIQKGIYEKSKEMIKILGR